MDNHEVLNLMQHAADTAILPRWRSLTDAQVSEKRPGDLVTIADTDAEKIITKELGEAFPEAIILGEEAASANPDLFERFYAADHAFTVDPIDGTANFVNGSQDFAVMIAEIKQGETVRSWIWQPAQQVSFTAEKGAGAYRNDTRLKTRKIDDDVSAWRGVTSRNSLKKYKFKPLSRLHSAWWCCGVDYPNIALGRADFVVYKHVMPWDHAPGALILSEVGGQAIHRNGKNYSPAKPHQRWLIAGSSDIPRKVLPYMAQCLTSNSNATPGEGPEPEDILAL